jgi:hypothetical protein
MGFNKVFLKTNRILKKNSLNRNVLSVIIKIQWRAGIHGRIDFYKDWAGVTMNNPAQAGSWGVNPSQRINCLAPALAVSGDWKPPAKADETATLVLSGQADFRPFFHSLFSRPAGA